MGDLIELPYRHFSASVIQKLIGLGYLRFSDRHKPEAVKRAWDCFRERISRMVRDRDQLS
jgi:hypothetical protein